MRERLLLISDDLSPSKAIQLACLVESAATCAAKIAEAPSPTTVTELAMQKVQPASPQQDMDPCFPFHKAQQPPARFRQRCGNCGSTRHEARAPDCPARGQTRRISNRPNHFARWCCSAPAGIPAQQPHPPPATFYTVLSNPISFKICAVYLGDVCLPLLLPHDGEFTCS